MPSTPVPATTAPATTTVQARPIDAGIEAYGYCVIPSLEPTDIVLTCADDGIVFQGLHWTRWNAASAAAVGTLAYKRCVTNCAVGGFGYVPNTAIVLTDPVRGVDGQVVWSRIQENPEPPGFVTGPYQSGPQPLQIGPD